MDFLRERVRTVERAYLIVALALAALAGACVAASYVTQGDVSSSLDGTAAALAITAAVALTAVGLQAVWHGMGGRRVGLVLCTGLAFLVDAALATSVAYIVGPPDAGLVYAAIFLGAAGVATLIGDGIWTAVRVIRHRGIPGAPKGALTGGS